MSRWLTVWRQCPWRRLLLRPDPNLRRPGVPERSLLRPHVRLPLFRRRHRTQTGPHLRTQNGPAPRGWRFGPRHIRHQRYITWLCRGADESGQVLRVRHCEAGHDGSVDMVVSRRGGRLADGFAFQFCAPPTGRGGCVWEETRETSEETKCRLRCYLAGSGLYF